MLDFEFLKEFLESFLNVNSLYPFPKVAHLKIQNSPKALRFTWLVVNRKLNTTQMIFLNFTGI